MFTHSIVLSINLYFNENKKKIRLFENRKKYKNYLLILQKLYLLSSKSGILKKCVFPDPKLILVFFRFIQAFWRKIRALKSTNYYLNDKIIHRTSRSIFKLFFLPENRVIFEFLKNI